MKIRSLTCVVLLLALIACAYPASAQTNKHPTVTAIHRYGHRKTTKVKHTVKNAGHNVKKWGHRKRHNVRAWLNKH